MGYVNAIDANKFTVGFYFALSVLLDDSSPQNPVSHWYFNFTVTQIHPGFDYWFFFQ